MLMGEDKFVYDRNNYIYATCIGGDEPVLVRLTYTYRWNVGVYPALQWSIQTNKIDRGSDLEIKYALMK